MRIQLWSSNYDPEPQGIAPLSGTLARGLVGRGHDVSVVAAHPHYPEPAWGSKWTPYREVRDGVRVLRLPLWYGRGSGVARIRQELSHAASVAAAAPFLGRPDVIIAVSPSFLALGVAMAASSARNVPWVQWLQDIVTDGAATTGQLEEGRLLAGARRFERRSYRSASRVVVISNAFRENLIQKGIDADQIVRIYNPTSRTCEAPNDLAALMLERPRVLAMGNIGHTQGLDRIVTAFEGDVRLRELDAELVIAGSGVAADAVRSKIQTDKVRMAGVLYGEELLPTLRSASLGLVSQRDELAEFNLPSKLMNYMSHGVPVLASVNPSSETAKIVRESEAGWVTDAREPERFAAQAADVLRDRAALERAGANGFRYARERFSPETVVEQFEEVLERVVGEELPTVRTRRPPRPGRVPEAHEPVR